MFLLLPVAPAIVVVSISSKDSTKKDSVAPWKIKYGALVLNNVDFTYRLSDLLTKVYQLFTEVKKLKVEMLNN